MIMVPAEDVRGFMEMLSIGSSILQMRRLRMRVPPMTDHPVDLDKHRGMAAQKATDLRRALAEVEAHVRELREREAELEHRMMTVPAASWPEAAIKARHLLNLYAASLPVEDTRHRALVAALLDDFVRLSGEE